MRGLFPGRFQPFHEGHWRLVQRILQEAEEAIVGVGSAQTSHTRRNPFTAGERITMIDHTFEGIEATIFVVPIEDINRYAVWPAHVQAICPSFDIVFSNNPVVDRVCSDAGLSVRGFEPIERDRFRGTEIRRRMLHDEPWEGIVPDPVAKTIREIDGIDRLKRIANHGDQPSDRDRRS